MIHIDRSEVPNPFELDPKLDQRGQEEVKRFEELLNSGALGQRRFSFKVYRRPDVRDALSTLFHGKCAYCESVIGTTQAGDIDHFRPKTSVVENPDHPGYWWLVNTWENMLIACIDCNRPRRQAGPTKIGMSGKGNRFPIADESKRAFKPGNEQFEERLLLDPTVDNPEEHFVYSEDGIVVSDKTPGITTISVLGLNRQSLVTARENAAMSVRKQIENYEFLERRFIEDRDDMEIQERLIEQMRVLNRLAEASQEYAGLKRQLIRPVLKRLDRFVEREPSESDWESSTPKISKTRQKQAKRFSQAYQMEMSDYSLEEEAGIEKYRLQRRLIERITMHNVRAIRDLDLDLTTHSDGGTPWHMLLGENGTCKSTVLQAVALVLVGADYFRELVAKHDVHPESFVRYRCKSGWIKVKLSGFPKPHELIFRKDRVEFRSPTGASTTIHVSSNGDTNVEGQRWSPQTVLLGYGATRLLPRHTSTERFGGDFARVDNLFDPFVPLFDADTWLQNLGRKQFDDAVLVLKDLLSLDEGAELVKGNDRILVKAHRSRTPLKQLSDGYQTIVATTVDILEVALRLWPNLADAEGIVLLDEIGAHLHPTWKMQIVRSLKRALPGVQFLATTHQPLCLRGLDAGEVIVMQRNEDEQIVAVTELPSPGDFRVDQLLTSEFFGLNSTVDPDVEVLFDEYYALLALEQLSEREEERLGELREQLKDRRHLGNTLRENLMYDAIDSLIAEQKVGERQPFPELKQEAVDQVSRIWSEAVNAEEGKTS
jgi:uncharacterized protein (TIGR02646 family)